MTQPIPRVTFGERIRLRRQESRVDMLLSVPRRHGPIARMSLWGGLVQANVVTDPALAHAVLVEHNDAFMKGPALSFFMKPMLGNGLLSSEGDFHRKQRRMLAPSFMPRRLADYAATIAARSEATQAPLRDGAAVDVNTLMMRLTLEIVGATLFGAEVGAAAEEVHAALSDAMEQMSRTVRAVISPTRWSR